MPSSLESSRDPSNAAIPNDSKDRGLPENAIVGVKTITLKSGRSIDLPVPGVTAVVGANNVGKSTLLREILEGLQGSRSSRDSQRLIESQQLFSSGTASDLVAWLHEHAQYVKEGRRSPAGFVRLEDTEERYALPVDEVERIWAGVNRDHGAGKPGSLGKLASYLVHSANWDGRRSMVRPVEARDSADKQPSHPLHLMQDNQELARLISELSRDVFGHPLTLDLTSKRLQLRVGRTDVRAPRLDESQAEYRESLATLRPLHDQGDGMTSFLGMLIPLVTSSRRVIVIDEPEAFLHPPQAVALGRALSNLANEKNLQIILATHDRNILTGLLDATGVPISIVRLHRVGDVTVPFQLDPVLVRELWTDPTLRYTNVLDGLFHKLAVIAEADRDCRFYEAAFDATHEVEKLPIPPSDVLFVPANGKAGIARLVRLLAAVRVPVVACPDLDILNDQHVLKQLVEQIGGTWDVIARDYQVATEPFRQPRDSVKCGQVLSALNSILACNPDAPYDVTTRESVMAALRSNESPWTALKRSGDRAFIGAQATAAGERLLDELDAMGVVAVRVGELERFARRVECTKGAAWLACALEANVHRSQEAVSHTRRVIASWNRRQTPASFEQVKEEPFLGPSATF